ncbi:hypothetical protein [Methylobacterium iners]|uniref:Transposase n=1 Tax=Methylobacterium iners TaxID=418707 RepID=A0ABQ4S368_9HYPH|nr:hypothetical protein [Methylobacterium iners]GJD97580.1 hypothetical protein OCOJLMKI_4812 [Methylobacterium iners]
MKTDGRQVCEVKVEGSWRLVTLDEVLTRYRMDRKRCPMCHGLVVVYGAYTPSARPILAHYRKHAGCSLNRETYSGTPSPHPKALT